MKIYPLGLRFLKNIVMFVENILMSKEFFHMKLLKDFIKENMVKWANGMYLLGPNFFPKVERW